MTHQPAYYAPIPHGEILNGEISNGEISNGDTAGDGYEYFQPSVATISVWSTQLQHGGPVSGLLVRAIENSTPDPVVHTSRVTIDILGAVGLTENRVRARVIRPGRQIRQVQAELETRAPDGTFRVAARATAWQHATTDTSAIVRPPTGRLQPGPQDLTATVGISPELGVDWGTTGFIGTVEYAPVPARDGRTPAAWVRPLADLVEGERASALQRFFTVVDVANGLGTTLRPDQWSWMNTDTTVHLVRAPRGTWFGIDSDLSVGPDGLAATFSDLFDDNGCVGRGAQTVLLSRQSPG